MIRLKPLVALLLSLFLMLGSVAGAVARSEMSGATDQTLCGAAGATVLRGTTVLRGARGRPCPKRRACPHCLAVGLVAGLVAVLPVPGLTAEPKTFTASTSHPNFAVCWQDRPSLTPSARGPPRRF